MTTLSSGMALPGLDIQARARVHGVAQAQPDAVPVAAQIVFLLVRMAAQQAVAEAGKDIARASDQGPEHAPVPAAHVFEGKGGVAGTVTIEHVVPLLQAAPGPVDQGHRGLHQDARARRLRPIDEIALFGGVEIGSWTEQRIETAHARRNLSAHRHVGAHARDLSRLEVALLLEEERRHVRARYLCGLLRDKDLPEENIRLRVGAKGGLYPRQPVGGTLRVVVGKGQDLTAGRFDEQVQREALARGVRADQAQPLRRAESLPHGPLRRLRGALIEHDDLVILMLQRQNRAQTGDQVVGPVARGYQNRELHRFGYLYRLPGPKGPGCGRQAPGRGLLSPLVAPEEN